MRTVKKSNLRQTMALCARLLQSRAQSFVSRRAHTYARKSYHNCQTHRAARSWSPRRLVVGASVAMMTMLVVCLAAICQFDWSLESHRTYLSCCMVRFDSRTSDIKASRTGHARTKSEEQLRGGGDGGRSSSDGHRAPRGAAQRTAALLPRRRREAPLAAPELLPARAPALSPSRSLLCAASMGQRVRHGASASLFQCSSSTQWPNSIAWLLTRGSRCQCTQLRLPREVHQVRTSAVSVCVCVWSCDCSDTNHRPALTASTRA